MSDSLIDYIAAVSLTIMLMIVVGAVFFYALSVWADRKRRILEHEEALQLAEIEASMTHLTALQSQILEQHYAPEMEILYAHSLESGDSPEYLDMLERFRVNYPNAYVKWVRLRGMDSMLDDHVATYSDWDEVQP